MLYHIMRHTDLPVSRHPADWRTLHFSRSAPAVVFGYLLFKRIEIRNIKIVIESLRYGIDKDMVLPRLITEKG